ncbi:hypothetical protein [Roseovarius sp.]|uniref:hypothetical protein n=1 Tax=Roseovarius sp. TaxID=1486281 RepID=UPI003A978310
MANPNPPEINIENLPDEPSDATQRFQKRLRYRILSSVDAYEKGVINAAFMAFETLGTLMPLLCAGYIKHEDVKGAYPFDSWRDQTVTIPAELFEAIIRPFDEYRSAGNSKSLDACFGFERITGQGKPPMKKVQIQRDRMRKIAASVARERIFLVGVDETPNSLERAYALTAEEHNVSTDTARRAYKEFGKWIIQSLQTEC